MLPKILNTVPVAVPTLSEILASITGFIYNLLFFAANLFDAVTRDLSRADSSPTDRMRTVPICTDYVTTRSFDLEAPDFEFLVESARRSTRAFLLEYDQQPHPAVDTEQPD